MEPKSLTARSPTLVTFKDIHVNFTREEWNLLDAAQQIMYKDVMLENYKNLVSVGHQLPKPDVILQLEKGEEPWLVERGVRQDTRPDWDTAVEIKSISNKSISKGKQSYDIKMEGMAKSDLWYLSLEEVWKCEDQLDKYQESQEGHLRAHISFCISELTFECDPMHAMNVGSLTARGLTSSCITELTLDSNPLSAKIVENASVEVLTFSHTREPTLERNHMNAMTVENPSARVLPSLYIREFILGRNPMNVVSAGKPSFGRMTLLSIRGSMLEKRPINVTSVESSLARALHV
ncbi:hypothetical protein HJG60_008974 [Phyllostomus discolor]|uniref:KRAB domain-containing protein n=1 Tax=Phyllostomus discolor TaxID=89673 RepID=A0A833YMP3_9CHIR|nr:hypothetical protein HJG60_008974 [Phyllostomus discolor]